MKKTVPPHVITVFRGKLVMCTPNHPDPLVFKFTPAMIWDLEVVDRNQLESGIRSFIQEYKLKPDSLVIILHNSVYFDKDYPGPETPSPQNTEEFMDTIPFSTTSSKLFRNGTGFKQIVINRDLYESVKKAFEDVGYQVSAVVPGFVLGPAENQQEFNAESCRLIYKKMDQITAESFTSSNDALGAFQQKEQIFLKKYQWPVIVVSILSLVVLAIVVPMTLRRPPTPIKKPVVPVVRKPTATPSPSPEPVQATPSAEMLSRYSAQILNGSGRTGQAAQLSDRLQDLGFTNITTGNNATVQETQVIMSPRLYSVAGEYLTEIVSELYPDISSTTSSEAKYDITVIIGRISP